MSEMTLECFSEVYLGCGEVAARLIVDELEGMKHWVFWSHPELVHWIPGMNLPVHNYISLVMGQDSPVPSDILVSIPLTNISCYHLYCVLNSGERCLPDMDFSQVSDVAWRNLLTMNPYSSGIPRYYDQVRREGLGESAMIVLRHYDAHKAQQVL